ncbi:MAG TPA: hypothetical protein PKJ08_10790, partial [Candidatus Cloacimonadota bacterium]|nr:hypothetical protein [Candidatus Cloacimonadota bacterium]
CSQFDLVFNGAFHKKDQNKSVYAYLVDNWKYKNMLTQLEKKHIPTYHINETKNNIRDKYLKLKKEARSKEEIELLLKDEEQELGRVIDKSILDMMASVIKDNKDLEQITISEPYISYKNFNGKMIDLKSLSSENRITDNINNEIKALENELDRQIYSLSDPDQIMKIKSQFKRSKQSLISKSDFITSLRQSSHNDADNPKLIEVIGNILVRYNDWDTQKEILRFSEKSISKKWLKYLHNLILKNTNKEVSDAILVSIRVKKSSQNLEFISKSYSNGSLYAYLLLVEHLISLKDDYNEKDIANLITYKNQINLYSFNSIEKKAIYEYVSHLIEEKGKSSKALQILKEQKPDSRDISIEYEGEYI